MEDLEKKSVIEEDKKKTRNEKMINKKDNEKEKEKEMEKIIENKIKEVSIKEGTY